MLKMREAGGPVRGWVGWVGAAGPAALLGRERETLLPSNHGEPGACFLLWPSWEQVGGLELMEVLDWPVCFKMEG